MGECLMFGLDLESRTLCSSSDEEAVRFLIGTNNIKLDNQVGGIIKEAAQYSLST